MRIIKKKMFFIIQSAWKKEIWNMKKILDKTKRISKSKKIQLQGEMKREQNMIIIWKK